MIGKQELAALGVFVVSLVFLFSLEDDPISYEQVQAGKAELWVPAGWEAKNHGPTDPGFFRFSPKDDDDQAYLIYAYDRHFETESLCELPSQIWPDAEIVSTLHKQEQNYLCIQEMDIKTPDGVFRAAFFATKTQELTGVRPLGEQYLLFAAPINDYNRLEGFRSATLAFHHGLTPTQVSKEGVINIKEGGETVYKGKDGQLSVRHVPGWALIPDGWEYSEEIRKTNTSTHRPLNFNNETSMLFQRYTLSEKTANEWGQTTNELAIVHALTENKLEEIALTDAAIVQYQNQHMGLAATGTAKRDGVTVNFSVYREQADVWVLTAPEGQDMQDANGLMATLYRWDVSPMLAETTDASAQSLATLIASDSKYVVSGEIVDLMAPAHDKTSQNNHKTSLRDAINTYVSAQAVASVVLNQ